MKRKATDSHYDDDPNQDVHFSIMSLLFYDKDALNVDYTVFTSLTVDIWESIFFMSTFHSFDITYYENYDVPGNHPLLYGYKEPIWRVCQGWKEMFLRMVMKNINTLFNINKYFISTITRLELAYTKRFEYNICDPSMLYFTNITHLDIHGSLMMNITDEGLIHLINITHLNMSYNQTITTKSLCCLENLEDLWIDHSFVSLQKDLINLKVDKLQYLRITEPHMTNEIKLKVHILKMKTGCIIEYIK